MVGRNIVLKIMLAFMNRKCYILKWMVFDLVEAVP